MLGVRWKEFVLGFAWKASVLVELTVSGMFVLGSPYDTGSLLKVGQTGPTYLCLCFCALCITVDVAMSDRF